MDVLVRLVKTTIGGKAIVGLTGLALSLFVMAHMAGNMLILVSPEMYNKYGHALITNPLIYAAEAGLIVMFVVHLGKALALTFQNFAARPQKYAVSGSGEKATSATTKTMWAQGLVILVFVILHLFTFKFGNYYEVTYGEQTMRDLHRLVIEVFLQPGYVIGYIIALLVLGFHLSHGVGSSFQTLGLHHPKYTPMIKCFSILYAIIVAGGFISQPLYVFLIHRG
jgi:succinate dehydrogenase / fumarate reductase cytochrome b subunit